MPTLSPLGSEVKTLPPELLVPVLLEPELPVPESFFATT